MTGKFELAHAAELQPHLAVADGKNTKTRKAVLRKVVSNMIVNNQEMLTLYPEILHCLQSSDSEIKRMCFLYLETYCKLRPRQLPETLQRLYNEVCNEQSSSGTRAAALRTLSCIPSKPFAIRSLELIPAALKSPDPYLRKTACFAVAKVWSISRAEVESSGVLGRLNQLLVKETSPTVVAAAAQSLLTITDQSLEMDFVIDFNTTKRLANLIADCQEFSQVYLLTAILKFVPQKYSEAEELAQLITPGLRHTNAAVAMGTARVLTMLSHYSPKISDSVSQQIIGPMLSQLNRPAEIQYSVLRNIQLILQAADPDTIKSLRIPPQTFFCKTSDMPYIRATKIDILAILCTPANADMVVQELIEFIHVQNDAATQRRAISVLAKLAIKFEALVSKTVQVFKQVISQRVSESGHFKSVNETKETAIAEFILLARKYPENTELIEQIKRCVLASQELPAQEDARSAYIWLAGNFESSPDKVVSLFSRLIDNLRIEKSSTQLALMTACLKVFFRFPQQSLNKLVPNIFEITTNQCIDPDVRDRALFYWRLYSHNIKSAEDIVGSALPPILKNDDEAYDYSQLEDLELSMGYLSSIYLKPADKLFRACGTRQLISSPALLPRKLNKLQDLSPEIPRSLSMEQNDQVKSPNQQIKPASSRYNGTSVPPAPPAPRPHNARQSTLLDQFQEFQLNSPTDADDQNVRLIDI